MQHDSFRRVLLALLVAHPLLAIAQNDGTMETLKQYSRAINTNDCEVVSRLTSDAVTRRDAFPGEFRNTMCGLLAQWHRAKLRETLGTPRAHLVDGWRRMVFVRATREMEQPPNRMTTDFD